MENVEAPYSGRTGELCLPPRFRKARLNPLEAVEYLAEIHGVSIAHATLAKLRCVGGGAAFQKFGRSVLYPRQALDVWALDKLGKPIASTSVQGAA